MEGVDFRGKFLLAPMAGITDSPFRLLCRQGGADAVVTEMTSAKGLLARPERTARFLEFDPRERPVGAQLYGSVPAEMALAARRVAEAGFDFLDINMGCPVRKVTAAGAGAALLAFPALCGELVTAAVEGSGIPVTVKIRSAFAEAAKTYLDVAREVFAAGAAAVTLHPRSRGQMFSGAADWTLIRRLKEEFPDRLVIGNGDVRTPEDARRMIAETGCDAVMIGRGALGNPWIFSEIRAGGAAPPNPRPQCAPPRPDPAKRRAAILWHGEAMHLRFGKRGIVAMRKHLAWYSRGMPGAAAFRGELARIDSLESFRTAVERFF